MKPTAAPPAMNKSFDLNIVLVVKPHLHDATCMQLTLHC